MGTHSDNCGVGFTNLSEKIKYFLCTYRVTNIVTGGKYCLSPTQSVWPEFLQKVRGELRALSGFSYEISFSGSIEFYSNSTMSPFAFQAIHLPFSTDHCDVLDHMEPL